DNSGIVEVADAGNGNDESWDAGWDSDDCYVTIGESTSTVMVLAVGNEGADCDVLNNYYPQAGDPVTVTLYNPDGSTYGTSTPTTVAANAGNAPAVTNVDPPDGPEGGGTTASSTGTVTVSTTNSTSPEAFWFGTYEDAYGF